MIAEELKNISYILDTTNDILNEDRKGIIFLIEDREGINTKCKSPNKNLNSSFYS
jgi:hypothetical protein